MGGISTAEKRAQLEAAGEPWPLYPDGTKMLWMKSERHRGGGRWRSFETTKNCRMNENAGRLSPGQCSAKDCTKAKHKNSTGTYEPHCSTHRLMRYTLWNSRRQVEKATKTAEELYA